MVVDKNRDKKIKTSRQSPEFQPVHDHQRLLIQCHFTCVLTLCYFSWKLEKKPLMTGNKVRHSSLSYEIFTMQVKAAIQIYCVQGYRLSAKKEQKHMRQSTFFFLCG